MNSSTLESLNKILSPDRIRDNLAIKISEILTETIEDPSIKCEAEIEVDPAIVALFIKTKRKALSSNYFRKIFFKTKLEINFYIYALMLVDKLLSNKSINLTHQNAENIYYACLLISIKILSDKIRDNETYAEYSKLTLKVMNQMEYSILTLLNFETFLSEKLFLHYEEYILEILD